MARMLAEGLGEAGWESVVCTRLGEALVAIESQSFSAVVSDVEIPDGNGFELILRVRTQPGPAPPVILMSSFHSPENSRRAAECGAFGYLPRPFEWSALVRMLEKAHSEIERG